MKKPSQHSLTTLIQTEAEQCVKCGLCLPHCPTYNKTQHEGESPRGRIALMEKITQGHLPITAIVKQHLDQCLTCRACEKVCPAHVPYGQLIDHTRAWLTQQGHHTLPKIIDMGVTKPYIFKWLFRLLRFYQISGLQKCLTKSGLIAQLKLSDWDNLLPILHPTPKWRPFYPAQDKEKGRIALFLGCVQSYLDPKSISDSLKVLTTCGYSVYIPPQQLCCGALHLHTGLAQPADTFAKCNRKIFAPLPGCSAIISLASGCGVTLAEQSFSLPIIDISQFLQDVIMPKVFQPLPMKVILHTPCTLEFGLQQGSAPYSLLKQIPQLTLITLPNSCCGAGGINMVNHSKMANALLDEALNLISDATADALVTSNLGCMLHFARGLKQRAITIPSLHPINLIAKALPLA